MYSTLGPPKPKKNIFRCIVDGCETTTRNEVAKLHSFPILDETRVHKWLLAVNRVDLIGKPMKALSRFRVCDLHFSASCRRGKGMKLWDPTAVPTLRLEIQKSDKYNTEYGLPTPKPWVTTSPTILSSTLASMPQSTMLMPQSPSSAPMPATTDSLSITPGYFFLLPKSDPDASVPITDIPRTKAPTTRTRIPSDFFRLISFRKQMKKKNTPTKGRYDKNFAVFALNLYLSCPSAYRVLWKTFGLPSLKVLPRVDLSIGTRINDNLVKCLESKMEKVKPLEKECVLCVDEVELTQKLFYAVDKDEIIGFEEIGGMVRCAPATRALMLVLRGVHSGWTQPLCYFYLAKDTDVSEVVDNLKRFILTTMYYEMNCKVMAIVSALGPTFTNLARALEINVESPFLIHPRNGRRVYYLYDLEQLILTLRDTLMAYDVKFKDIHSGSELRASWSDVTNLARVDSERALRLVPELNRACVYPTPLETQAVRHATALFSRNVAAQMSASGDVKGHSGTARLLLLVAELLKALEAPRARDFPRAAKAIDEFSSCLSDVSLLSQRGGELVSDAEVFVSCVRLTLANMQRILEDRFVEATDPHRTSPIGRGSPLRLAHYSLRPVRRCIERMEGVRGRVVPVKFRKQFRSWVMRNLIGPIGKTIHETDNIGGLLKKASDENLSNMDSAVSKSVAIGDYRHKIDVRVENSFDIVTSRLLQECQSMHSCFMFIEYAENIQRFSEMIRSMNRVFKEMFRQRMLNVVGLQLLPALQTLVQRQAPCLCFPTHAFCRLFVRFRIRAAIQTYNDQLGGTVFPACCDQWLFQ